MRREIIAHLLASIGVISAMMALLAVFDQGWEYVYGWLGLALLTQAVSAGDFAFLPLADHDDFPDSDQAILHARPAAIVAFLTGVFVPVIAMLHAGFLDGVAGAAFGGVILLAALYRLVFVAQPQEPASRIVGLPAAWSIVGFYLHAFDATPLASVLGIGLGIVLGLIPLNWPHPLFSERWPAMTRTIVVIWLITAACTLWYGFPASPLAKSILLVIAIYGLILTARIARTPTPEQELT